MKCQLCDKRSTVHLTEIVKGKKREIHLCQGCAKEQEISVKVNFTLPDLLQGLISSHVGQASDELAKLTCPACGIGFMEFRTGGRLGCAADYDVFQRGLAPLIEKLHGAAQHVGKTPHRSDADLEYQAELTDLRRQLRAAVDTENYEEAARLRDLLREKEKEHATG
jgi:protein arginine kinase activator